MFRSFVRSLHAHLFFFWRRDEKKNYKKNVQKLAKLAKTGKRPIQKKTTKKKKAACTHTTLPIEKNVASSETTLVSLLPWKKKCHDRYRARWPRRRRARTNRRPCYHHHHHHRDKDRARTKRKGKHCCYDGRQKPMRGKNETRSDVSFFSLVWFSRAFAFTWRLRNTELRWEHLVWMHRRMDCL